MSGIREVERRLNPGWRLEGRGQSLYAVIDPSGHALRGDGGGRELRINIHLWDGSVEQRKLVAQLQSLGAIPKSRGSRRRRAVEEHKPRQVYQAANPIILSRAILADSRSTPRERKIAKEYLKLLETHESVRALAKALGERLREYNS